MLRFVTLTIVLLSVDAGKLISDDHMPSDDVSNPASRRQLAKSYDREYSDLSADQKLIASCFTWDKQGVVMALRRGAHVNARFGKSRASLHILFADSTAAVTSERVAGWTPLVALLRAPYNVDASHPPAGSIILRDRNTRFEILDILLSHNCNVNLDDANERTPVFIASERRDPDALKTLLEFGANANHIFQGGFDGIRGTTPLHKAILSYECVALLLNYGADPEVKDSDGLTPINWSERLGTKHRILKTEKGWGVQIRRE